MGNTTRPSFALGWMPDADAVNVSAEALLRADNLILDELGVPAVRYGSVLLETLADSDVHSLFTAILNGTRYRMVGAGNDVYANGSNIISGVGGSGDVAFGSHRGEILIARGSTKKKYNGALTNWGIAMSGAAPTVVAIAPDSKTFASCDSGESPAFTEEEGQDGPAPTFATGQDGTSNGSVQAIPSASTGRSTITKKFGSPVDFTVYDAGQTGLDSDLFEMYVYIVEPTRLAAITVMVDVNSSSTSLFQDDFYSFKLTPDSIIPITSSGDVRPILPVTYHVVKRAEANEDDPFVSNTPQFTVRPDSPVSNAGWNKVQIPRSAFQRQGATSGKGWNSVIAIRFVTESVQGNDPVRFDTVKIVGGNLSPLTGTDFQWIYVYVSSQNGYIALSAPSAASALTSLQANGATVTVPSDGGRDGQVNEIWLFRIGGGAQQYLRVIQQTGVSGTGSVAITDTVSVQDSLVIDIPLQIDNDVPPDDIIGITGPYYERTFALTATDLYPSRQLNMDSFAQSQVVAVAGADEQCLWVKQAFGGLYIGTTKDIYRLDGDGSELPDDSVNFTLVPMGIDHPPVNNAIAQDGNLLIYFADDGWRAAGSNGSQSLTGTTSLLYRGQTRHGVSPVNVTGGRFRATIAKGQLICVTPEGANASSSPVLYRYRGGLPSVYYASAPLPPYRHVYPMNFRVVYREPDGTLLGGTDGGAVWILDTGTTDAGAAIPVTLWTKVDDLGASAQRKRPWDLHFRSDTGGSTAALALHKDGSDTATASVSMVETGIGVAAFDLSDLLGAFRHVQLRLTGSFSAFHLYDYTFGYDLMPVLMLGRTPRNHFGYPGIKTLSGVQVRLCTLGAAVVVTPVLDGVSLTPYTVTSDRDDPIDTTLDFVASLEGVELALHFSGDVELYAWKPIVTAQRPLGVKTWDSGPIDLGSQELVWLRELFLKVRGGADLTITPWFDGVAFPAVTAPITPGIDTVVPVPIGRHYVGRQPRLVVTSTQPFFPYWIKVVRRTTGLGTQKPSQVVPVSLNVGVE